MTHAEIVAELVEHLRGTSFLVRKLDRLPLDQSLVELGILDSFGVVELVTFIEDHWSIAILDSELTNEMFGGINKMATLIGLKLAS